MGLMQFQGGLYWVETGLILSRRINRLNHGGLLAHHFMGRTRAGAERNKVAFLLQKRALWWARAALDFNTTFALSPMPKRDLNRYINNNSEALARHTHTPFYCVDTCLRFRGSHRPIPRFVIVSGLKEGRPTCGSFMKVSCLCGQSAAFKFFTT